MYKFTDGCPHHYLNEGPDVVDEGAGEQHVDDDQHDEAEDVQGQAAELLVLRSIVYTTINISSSDRTWRGPLEVKLNFLTEKSGSQIDQNHMLPATS